MSKKKMVAAEFNTVSTDEKGRPVESPVQADANATVAEKAEDASLNGLSGGVREKLEQFEKMERTVSELSKENEALKDKVAEYLEELERLRNRQPEVREVVKEVPVEKVVEKVVEKPAGEDSAKLASELKTLREESDSYLMKISELTFENARLTASLAELEKQAAERKPEQQAQAPMQQYVGVYRGNTNANGYSSWN